MKKCLVVTLLALALSDGLASADIFEDELAALKHFEAITKAETESGTAIVCSALKNRARTPLHKTASETICNALKEAGTIALAGWAKAIKEYEAEIEPARQRDKENVQKFLDKFAPTRTAK